MWQSPSIYCFFSFAKLNYYQYTRPNKKLPSLENMREWRAILNLTGCKRIYGPVSDWFTVYHPMNINHYFFLKHFSGPESGILEFDWLLTRVPPVQFFPIRTGFVMVTARIYRAKTIEWKFKNNIPRLNSRIFLFTAQRCDFFGKSQFLCVL